MWDPDAEEEPHVLDLVAGWLRENPAVTSNEVRGPQRCVTTIRRRRSEIQCRLLEPVADRRVRCGMAVDDAFGGSLTSVEHPRAHDK